MVRANAMFVGMGGKGSTATRRRFERSWRRWWQHEWGGGDDGVCGHVGEAGGGAWGGGFVEREKGRDGGGDDLNSIVHWI
jgi:hypothetical protein